MSKIKVSTLTGPLLDLWVAKAEGKNVRIIPSGSYPYNDLETEIFFHQDVNGYLYPGAISLNQDAGEYSPSTDWSQGGPIIEREKIGVIWSDNQDCWVSGINGRGVSGGPTASIAAMRCFVASKFGDEVGE